MLIMLKVGTDPAGQVYVRNHNRPPCRGDILDVKATTYNQDPRFQDWGMVVVTGIVPDVYGPNTHLYRGVQQGTIGEFRLPAAPWPEDL